MSDERNELDQVIRGLLKGELPPYRIIKGKIEQYVNHFGVSPKAHRQELVSDTLTTLLESLKAGKFCGNNLKSLNVYIFGIVRYKLYNEWRKKPRFLESEIIVDEIPSGEQGVDHHLARVRLVSRLLDALPEECRMLLTLKFQEGWSDQEIADHLKKSKNAVSTAISRCVKKAREML